MDQTINNETTINLRGELIKRYEPLLTKDHEYQMGDDTFSLSTEELTLSRALHIILNDLEKNKI